MANIVPLVAIGRWRMPISNDFCDMATTSGLQDQVQSGAPGGFAAGEIRVLLVDDLSGTLDLLEDVLTDSGYLSVRASNGIEALKLLAEKAVHIIVADAMMPKMDGFQLCKEVRAQHAFARIPFIIYSGTYVDDADQEFARKIGADRYVMKAAGLDPLTHAIDDLVQQRYGRKPGQIPTEKKERIGDQAFLEQHHTLVIKKLEEKMAELEQYARRLEAKNREIQISEDRYRSLFEHVSLAIFVVDRTTGRVLDVNSRGLSLLRMTRSELLGLAQIPFADDGGLADSIRNAEATFTGEAVLKTGDGEVLDVEVGVGPMTPREDTRILLYVRDVTEQLRLRAQLFQAEKLGLLGRLAAGIAHEIRNPLSAISLNLQYLLQKYGSNADICQSARDAFEGTQRVAAVVENTLGLARVSPPVLRPENINPLVETVVGFLRIATQQKDIQLESHLMSGLPPILADAKQVQQVVLNILQNAIDASPEHGIITVRTGRSGEGAVEIVVCDHGPGISAGQMHRLFEQFYTTKSGGTGLGLSLSKQIMDRHNGEIRVDMAPEGGAVVTVVFPARGA
jgi:PAS domain S-box-containing protein